MSSAVMESTISIVVRLTSTDVLKLSRMPLTITSSSFSALTSCAVTVGLSAIVSAAIVVEPIGRNRCEQNRILVLLRLLAMLASPLGTLLYRLVFGPDVPTDAARRDGSQP